MENEIITEAINMLRETNRQIIFLRKEESPFFVTDIYREMATTRCYLERYIYAEILKKYSTMYCVYMTSVHREDRLVACYVDKEQALKDIVKWPGTKHIIIKEEKLMPNGMFLGAGRYSKTRKLIHSYMDLVQKK